MIRLFLLALIPSITLAQFAITSPTAAQSIADNFSFTTTVANAPAATAQVKYCMDGNCEPMQPVAAAPWSGMFNSNWWYNGSQHEIIAYAYDANGTLLATTSPVDFTIANTQPNASTLSIATSTPVSSVWSGLVTITPTITGNSANPNLNFYVDGIVQPAGTIATTKFNDAMHVVAFEAVDKNNGQASTCGSGNKALGQWSRVIQFNNSGALMELRADAHELFLAPSATHTISLTVYKTNETTTTATGPAFQSNDTTIATVNGAGLVTAGSNTGSTTVTAMWSQVSGSDLHIDNGTGDLQSASHPFVVNDEGQTYVNITGGVGFTPGIYLCVNIELVGPTQSCTPNKPAGTPNSSGGTYTKSFGTNVWVFVAPANEIPHFNFSDGSVRHSYNASNSGFLSSGFVSGAAILGSGSLTSTALAAYGGSGFNALETDLISPDLTGYSAGQQTTWQNTQNAWVAGRLSAISGFPNLKFHLADSSLTTTGAQLFADTRGAPSAYSPSAVQYAFQSWTPGTSGGAAPIAFTGKDEVNNGYDHRPNTVVPYQFGNNGLSQIVCTAAPNTCTVTSTDWGFSSGNKLFIHGSANACFNGANNTSLQATSVDANTYTFPNPSCGNLTVNAGNDPGLTIEPYIGMGWFNSNTDYVHWDVFQNIRAAQNAVTGHVLMSYPNTGTTTASSIFNWENPSATGAVSDYADLYYANSGTINYLAHTSSTHDAVKTTVGDYLRSRYGAFNPQAPLIVIQSGTPQDYGFQGLSVPITSISGGVATFSQSLSAKAYLTAIVPGVTRMVNSGTTALNGNFYGARLVDDTHMLLVRAASDFTHNGSLGGTATFQDSSTAAIQHIDASGSNSCHGGGTAGGSVCGDAIQWVTCNATVLSKRGMTFTISGNADNNFNNNTWYYLPESVGSCSFTQFQREVPSQASTGGTANIIADNGYLKGRNWDFVYMFSKENLFGVQMELLNARVAGSRSYQVKQNQQFYDPANGFLGPNTATSIVTFGDTCNQTVQEAIYPPGNSWADAATQSLTSSGTNFSVLSTGHRLSQRILGYYFQQSLNSPDYGPVFEASAHSGSLGNMLLVENVTDAPQTRTINLSSYVVGGQNFLRYHASAGGIDVTVIPSGTTSDTDTWEASGGTNIYLFPNSFSTEYTAPKLAFNLGSVPGATSVAVKYGYESNLVTPRTKAANFINSPASLPADSKIGPIWVQLTYLNNSNVPLQTSSVFLLPPFVSGTPTQVGAFSVGP